MRLAEFIETSYEPILKEWVAFAKSCGPAAKLMDAWMTASEELERIERSIR